MEISSQAYGAGNTTVTKPKKYEYDSNNDTGTVGYRIGNEEVAIIIIGLGRIKYLSDSIRNRVLGVK